LSKGNWKSELIKNSDTAHGVEWNQCWQGVGTHKGVIIDGKFPRGCIYQHNVDISIETGRKWTGSCTSYELVHSSFKSCLIIGWSDSEEVNENGTGFSLVLKTID